MKKKQKKVISGTAILMCVLGAAFYYYEYYLRVAPSVMNSELKTTFHLGEAAFGHLAAFYYYAYTPAQIPAGVMMDRFGPRKILSFACLCCALGTYLFSATAIVWVAQIGRFLVGFGSAFAYVGVLKISNVWLPKKYFALMAGLCSALGMLGGISGQMLMSHWVDIVGWQATLYYSALVGLGLGLILWGLLRDAPHPDHHPHPLIAEPTVIEELCTKFSSLREMVLSRQMWIGGLIGCLTYLPLSGFAEVWAVNFLKVAGMSKAEAALGSSMVFLGFAVGGPLWGIASAALKSRRKPLMLGSFVSALLMALIIFSPSASIGWMYPLFFLAGFFASAEILVFAVSNDGARHAVSATAIGCTNMLVMVGGALTPPLIGKLLDATSHDYSVAFAIFPIALGVAGILSYLLKESYPE